MNLTVKYISKINVIFETALGNESGDHVNHEKSQMYPFKGSYFKGSWPTAVQKVSAALSIFNRNEIKSS
jgi:hypothetical protein